MTRPAVRPTATTATATASGPQISGIIGVQAGQTLKGAVAIEARVSGSEIDNVTFTLSGPKAATHIERSAPYFFMGDSAGKPYGWDTRGYPNGSYTLKAVVTDRSGRSAAAQITFQVGN